MGKETVVNDRHLYIGGSDIPIIMGISPFKKRFDLLLEKAQLQESDFKGNAYTEYGDLLEPQIRDYVNTLVKKPFKESCEITREGIRCNVDGDNGEAILEVKTTSQIHNSLEEYKIYLVQLLFYMVEKQRKKGKLAVYERPSDFNEVFDANRLTIYDVKQNDFKELIEDIYQAIDLFLIDLAKIKANPYLTEEELQPKELIELSNKVVALENELAKFKELEAQYDSFKNQLYNAMEKYSVKKWETPNGVKITKVDARPETTITSKEFNVAKFQEENSELYNNYLEEKTTTKKGAKGYVKITLPKVK